MLNILLGIGIGGFWMMLQDAKRRHFKHPKRPFGYKPYKIAIGPTLAISAAVLLLTLGILLVVVPWNMWILTRKLGLGLICLWMIGTTVNVMVEVSGAWSDISY
jgi:sodium/potassium/calcium exchanger 6